MPERWGLGSDAQAAGARKDQQGEVDPASQGNALLSPLGGGFKCPV